MDLLLRRRGAPSDAQASVWLVRAAGAVVAFGGFVIFDRLGFLSVIKLPSHLVRAIALFGGALIAPTAWGVVLWIGTGALTLLMLVIVFTPVVQSPALKFVRSDANTAPVDAIVVLSGSITEEGLLTAQVLERLLTGLTEVRRLGVSTMALSVTETGNKGSRVSSETDQRRLLATLAPSVTVHFVYNVHSTRDEAMQFRALSNTFGWKRVAVVTSPMHSRRACRTMEMAELVVTCVPAEPREYSLKSLKGPSARISVFRDLLYETLATLQYRTRGWI